MFYTSTTLPVEAEEISDATVNEAPRKRNINVAEKCDIELNEEVTGEIYSDEQYERKVEDSEEEFCEYF